MKQIVYIALVLLPMVTKGQTKAVVVNDLKQPMEYVLVVNQRTQEYSYTNYDGRFKLKTDEADTVIFMLAGYKALKIATTRLPDTITLRQLSYSMQEVEVTPELERFEKEHQEMLETYDKTFQDAKRKPKVYGYAGGMAGITVDGLISNFATKVSGKKKKAKRFAKDFEQTENDKFISLRYNPEVVMSATKTTKDSAVVFIREHPMEYDYAKTASSLELLMWIRYHFRQWTDSNSNTPDAIKTTD